MKRPAKRINIDDYPEELKARLNKLALYFFENNFRRKPPISDMLFFSTTKHLTNEKMATFFIKYN